METVKETVGAGDKPRRVIKRYSNRKLYDTKDSATSRSSRSARWSGREDVQIIDNATKEDKTEVTLALIISEDVKSNHEACRSARLRDRDPGTREPPLDPAPREPPRSNHALERPRPPREKRAARRGERPLRRPPSRRPRRLPRPAVGVRGRRGGEAARRPLLRDAGERRSRRSISGSTPIDERIRTILPGVGVQRPPGEVKTLVAARRRAGGPAGGPAWRVQTGERRRREAVKKE
jgi:hypothetical protein